MTYNFPKSRVCVVDVSLPFEEGFKRAMAFAKKYGIQINTADGRRIVTSFCIESITEAFNTTSSSFPKATCLSKKKVPHSLTFFVENYFNQILKQMPVHYCGIQDMTSPDLEHIAANALKQSVSKRDYNGMLAKLKIRKIA